MNRKLKIKIGKKASSPASAIGDGNLCEQLVCDESFALTVEETRRRVIESEMELCGVLLGTKCAPIEVSGFGSELDDSADFDYCGVMLRHEPQGVTGVTNAESPDSEPKLTDIVLSDTAYVENLGVECESHVYPTVAGPILARFVDELDPQSAYFAKEHIHHYETWWKHVPDIQWSFVNEQSGGDLLTSHSFGWVARFPNTLPFVSEFVFSATECAKIANLWLQNVTRFLGVTYVTSRSLTPTIVKAYWFGLTKLTPPECWAVLTAAAGLSNSNNSMGLAPYVEYWKNFVGTHYPAHFESEAGFFEGVPDMLAALKNICNLFYSMPGKIWKVLMDSCTQVLAGLPTFKTFPDLVCDSFVKSLSAFFKRMGNCVEEGLRKVTDIVTSSYFLSLMKMFFRVWFGYTPTQLVLELFNELSGHAGAVHKLLVELLTSDLQAEGNVETSTGVLAKLGVTLFTASIPTLTGYDHEHIVKMCRDVNTTAAAYDRMGLTAALESLEEYITGSKEEARRALWEKKYPATHLFMAMHTAIVKGGTEMNNNQRNSLQHAYGAYLDERRRWDQKDVQQLTVLSSPSARFAEKQGLNPSVLARRAPLHLCFVGEPGLGKSYINESLIQALARFHDQPAVDFAYTVNTLDRYSSGYVNQPVWRIDDLFQCVDTASNPSGDVELLFRLVTPAPLVLNMADVESKGKVGRCHLVVSSSNVRLDYDPGSNLQLLSRHIKSIKFIDAIRRRLTHIIVPFLKPGFKKVPGGVIEKRTGQNAINRVLVGDLFYFRVLGIDEQWMYGPGGTLNWSWQNILALAEKGIADCESFDPSLVSVESDLQFLRDTFPKGNARAEGFGSLFNWTGLASASKDITKRGSERISSPWTREDYAKAGLLFESFSPEIGFNDLELDAWLTEPYSGAKKRTVRCMFKEEHPDDVEEVICIDEQPITYIDKSHYVRGDEYYYCEHRDVWIVEHDNRVFDADLIARYVLAGLLGCVSLFVAGKAIARHVRERSMRYQWSDSAQTMYMFDHRSNVYDPEAANHPDDRVEIDGKFYVKKKVPNVGYKWYPEAKVPQDLTDMIIPANTRYMEQLPGLLNSVFAVTHEGKLIANVFAVSRTMFFCPKHVLMMIVEHDVVHFKRDSYVKEFVVKRGNMNYLTIQDLSHDMVCFEFLAQDMSITVPNVKHHFSKLLIDAVPNNGKCELLCRDANGRIHTKSGTFAMSTVMSQYTSSDGVTEYLLPPDSHRLVEVSSECGDCGGIYVVSHGNSSQTVLGMHVAGRTTGVGKFGVCHLFPRKAAYVNPEALRSTNSTPEGMPKCAPELVAAGVTVYGVAPHGPAGPSSTNRVRSPLYDDIKPVYDMSKLRPFETADGEWIDPLNKQLCKLMNQARKTQNPVDDLFDLAADLGRRKRASGVFVQDAVPTWADCTRGGRLPSIKRSASPGYPWIKLFTTKAGFCDPGCDVPELTEATVNMLDKYLGMVVPLDWASRDIDEFLEVDDLAKGCLKSEPRVLEKVEDGSTRLFTALAYHAFMAQRRYFYDLAACMSERNLAFESALGLAPSDFKHIHAHLFPDLNRKVLALDHKFMDGHVNPIVMHSVASFILSMYNAEGSERRKVGNFPLMDKRMFTMYMLLRRLADFQMVYRDAVIRPGTMHPSGSFLTCIINHIVQYILTVHVFRKVMELGVDEVLGNVRMVFLGDDSLITYPDTWKFSAIDYRRVAAEQGFEITGSDKGDVREDDPWNPVEGTVSTYGFLSRNFHCIDGEIEGLLEPERIEKVISFTDAGKMSDTFPEQFISFFQEIEPHTRSKARSSRAFVQKMRRVLDTRFGTGFFAFMLTSLKDEQFTEMKLRVMKAMEFSSKVPVMVCQAESAVADSSSMEKLGANTADDTTVFLEEIVEAHVDAQEPKNRETFKMRGIETGRHGEGKVFGRPHVIASFNWTGATPEDALLTYQPTGYFADNFNAQTKLVNYFAMHGVMCVRIVISSSPYAQGKLLLHARPLGNAAKNNVQASGDPCVEVDASSGTSATIKVPCVAPMGFVFIEGFDSTLLTGNEQFDWCQVGVRVLSPIQEVGSTNVTVKVWGWLEDVELRGPTLTSFPLTAQGRPKEDGTHGFLNKVHRSVKTIGGILTDSAIMVGKGMALAAMAGLSDPALSDNTTIVMEVGNFDAPHMVGVSPAVNMTVSQAQRIVLPVGSFSVEHDEMDCVSYASRMCFIRRFAWTAATVSETTIGTWRVSPGLYHEYTVDLQRRVQFTPLSAVASMFAFWQGKIRYRLAIAKTKFHAGLLEVVWTMGRGDNAIVTDSQAAICYRAEWDIQQSSSFEIECNYCSATNWSPVILENETDSGTRLPTSAHSTGYIQLRVINPLTTAQDLVTDSVEVLLYIAGGSDMKFAVPLLHHSTPFSSAVASKGKDEIPVVRFKAEGYEDTKVAGGVFQEDRVSGVESISTPLCLATCSPCSNFDTVSCIGEEITNLRMLTRRFSDVVSEATSPFDANFKYAFQNHPFMSRLLDMFAFLTGGVRYHIDAKGSTLTTSIKLLYQGVHYPGMAVMPYKRDDPIIIQIPYHNIVPYVAVGQVMNGVSGLMPFSASVEFGTDPVRLFVSGADDLNFGWQVGPEPRDYPAFNLPLPDFISY